ncbi:LPXTG cell wall anchor domain-containing protein [Plantibacter sp. YIM 135347]|uniref:LPXTG cell wall anchor domain-containing protein n=1 Tax=Plantibacter sp. YIM 135347 TaxID=3423919 RepID=UPI003D349E44
MTPNALRHAVLSKTLRTIMFVFLAAAAVLVSPFAAPAAAAAAAAGESAEQITPIRILSPQDGAIVQPGFVITGIGQDLEWVDITSDAWPPTGFFIDHPDGAWIQPTAQFWPAGTYTITFTQKADGSSDTLTVTIPPAPVITPVTITGPAAGSTVGPRPTLTGAGTPDAIVTITDGATTLGTATVGAVGAWTFTPSADLSLGARTFTATQDIDSSTATVAVTVEGVPPSPSPTPTPTPSPSPMPSPGAGGGTGGETGRGTSTGELPSTGADAAPLLPIGGLLAAAGVTATVLGRRKRTHAV